LPDGTVVDRTGKTIAQVPSNAEWGDGSQRLCAIRHESGGEIQEHDNFLFVYGLTGTSRRVASTPGPNSHGGVWPVCNFAADRAVIITSFVGSATIAKEIQLSTGAELPLPSLPSPLENLYTDGRLFAGSSADLTFNSVWRVNDGREVGRLGAGSVRALSSSGTAAVVSSPGGARSASVPDTPLTMVVDVTTRRTSWSIPASTTAAFPQPGGTDFMVFVNHPAAAQPPGHFDDVWLIKATGGGSLVAAHVPTGFYLAD
jgi:hypothetical protein